jgi:dienelactone hydrolase
LHKVGTKQIAFIDTLKITSKEIDIRLWYPTSGKGEKLKFADYLNPKNEIDASKLQQDISIMIGGKENLFPIDSLDLILNYEMKALKGAEAKTDRFPLLIWSMRYGTVEYQNILSEYIASHGYVVAFAEDIPNSPYPWQLQTAAKKANALDQQISDINNSIEYLKLQDNVDSTKIGLLSWSYAGESAILTQMNNPEIDLVIGLSSIGFTYGTYLGSELARKIDSNRLNVPYLMLFERIAPNGNTRTPPELFDAMHPNSRYISFGDLAHGNFNAMEGMIPGILGTNKVQSWSKGGEIAQNGYETICKMVISFLNAVFYEAKFTSFDEEISIIRENSSKEYFTITAPKTE